jgi:hypothetical protein
MLDKEKLLKSVKQLLQPQTILRTKEVQKEALKHDGLKNVAEAIVAAANNEQIF